MNINRVNNVSFRALLGQTEINHFQGSGMNMVTVTRHIYPFKGEIANKKQKLNLLEKCKEMFASEKLIPNAVNKHEFIIEQSLPFTKEEFELAKRTPNAPHVSQEAKEFVNSGYNAVTIKNTGYCMDTFV